MNNYKDLNPSYHPGLTPTVRGHFENDKYVFFWSGPFSNWDKGEFSMSFDDILFKFNCSEQAMMLLKAWRFGDTEAIAKVMKEKDPREQKKIGRAVKNFDEANWEKFALEKFPTVLRAKFEQVPGYEKILLDTGDKTIVEASPFDEVWGIKMGVNNPDILDETKWRGKNLLGICLMKTRDAIRASRVDNNLVTY